MESGLRVESVNNKVESVIIRVESCNLMVGSVIIRVELFNNRVERKKTHESKSAGGLVLTDAPKKNLEQ